MSEMEKEALTDKVREVIYEQVNNAINEGQPAGSDAASLLEDVVTDWCLEHGCGEDDRIECSINEIQSDLDIETIVEEVWQANKAKADPFYGLGLSLNDFL